MHAQVTGPICRSITSHTFTLHQADHFAVFVHDDADASDEDFL